MKTDLYASSAEYQASVNRLWEQDDQVLDGLRASPLVDPAIVDAPLDVAINLTAPGEVMPAVDCTEIIDANVVLCGLALAAASRSVSRPWLIKSRPMWRPEMVSQRLIGGASEVSDVVAVRLPLEPERLKRQMPRSHYEVSSRHSRRFALIVAAVVQDGQPLRKVLNMVVGIRTPLSPGHARKLFVSAPTELTSYSLPALRRESEVISDLLG